ncbi:hypothetical protein PC39_00010 [Salinisphaera sp. PC39]|uniref:Ig-like domain-containing protein n=1 Tax=Salinisphaera sp. PC39 TaxID=1304156 RepID=UPI0033408099
MSSPSTDAGGDVTAPRITAQYPSACLYTFGRTAFDASADLTAGLATVAASEAGCTTTNEAHAPPEREADVEFLDPEANSFPLDGNPAITFSEPVDPTSLDGNILMTDGGGTPVDVRLRAEGSSIVIDPANRLDADTEYTITVSNGVTDLAGNGLQGSYAPGLLTFTTETMVAPQGDVVPTEREPVRQAAPFLTVLTPGMPCALMSAADNPESDFREGGNMAGRCVGDSATQSGDFPPPVANPAGYLPVLDSPVSAEIQYPVFNHPANLAIEAHFSKPVRAKTVALADGCLIGGNGAMATSGTVAVQRMSETGECQGVVEGALTFSHPNAGLTRDFSFRPADGFEPGARYWIVVCGSPDPVWDAGPSECSSGQTILGQNGLSLNTTPLLGTGTRILGTNSRIGCEEGESTRIDCWDDNRGQGGPDIVMPFDGAPTTEDFYAVQLALPQTDTNGNGVFDNLPIPEGLDPSTETLIAGFHTGQDRSQVDRSGFNDVFGLERAQRANMAYVGAIKAFGTQLAEAAFLSGGQAVAIRQRTSGDECADAMNIMNEMGTRLDDSDDVPIVGPDAPEECVPVDLLPGGLLTLSAISGTNLTPTGRLLLRFPYQTDEAGNATDKPQRGYIVPRCQGSFQGEAYDYQPCFVGNLRVTVNANDAKGLPGASYLEPGGSLTLPQQDINVQAFGPVTLAHNGRQIISTRNANTFSVTSYLAGFDVGLAAPTNAGDQHLQLVGPPIHGGPVQSFDVP